MMMLAGGLMGAGFNIAATEIADFVEDGEFNKSFKDYLAAGIGGFIAGGLSPVAVG